MFVGNFINLEPLEAMMVIYFMSVKKMENKAEWEQKYDVIDQFDNTFDLIREALHFAIFETHPVIRDDHLYQLAEQQLQEMGPRTETLTHLGQKIHIKLDPTLTEDEKVIERQKAIEDFDKDFKKALSCIKKIFETMTGQSLDQLWEYAKSHGYAWKF